MTTTSMPTPLFDGYATIRSRGLCRSRSIRASEIEAEAQNNSHDDNNEHNHSNDFSRSPTTQTSMRPEESTPPTRIERKRTLSLKSNFSQNSSCSGSACHTPQHQTRQYQNHPHHHTKQQQQQTKQSSHESLYKSGYQPRARAVKTPTIGDYEPPIYASNNTCTTFRPLSDASSSSSGAGSMPGCRRDSVSGSTGSAGGISLCNADYQNVKKNSRFSLDSLQSSATPKTPDYATAEEENIFLYTAPESPHRRSASMLRRSEEASASVNERCYTPPTAAARSAFEMHELSRGNSSSEHSHSSASPIKHGRSSSATPQYQRTQSMVEHVSSPRPRTLLMTTSLHQQRSDSESPTYISRPPLSPTTGKMSLQPPPQAPVRRESLYQKPKIYSTPTINRRSSNQPSPCCSPTPPLSQPDSPTTHINYYQLPLPALTQRSSSAELLERSYTNQSLATIDQDEILVVPTAMPMLQNPVDRRYHTLGHMRVQSLGTSLHMSRDSPLGSMLNMMAGTYYMGGSHHHHYYPHLQPNKSAGNIYDSTETAADELQRLAPEYMDPLDFKIGCQTTLRSKPIIPWYELAIRRDFKRQSCPPISGGCSAAISSGDRSRGNQAHVVAAFEQSLSNMTSRLQQLTATAERKDGELTDMRQTIELLRKQSIQAGLTTAHMQSMGVQTQSQNQNDILGKAQIPPLPPGLTGHMNRVAQQQHQQQSQQQPTANASGANGTPLMQRHHSSDSMCSLNSISSGCSAQDKKKKKGWLRSSFTKAFSRNAKISKTSRHAGGGHHGHGNSAGSHADSLHNSTASKFNGHAHIEPAGLAALATQPAALPASPTKNSPAKTAVTLIENAKPIDAIDHEHEHQVVEDLKKQLREKDLVLTDIRLEALSSASQLENLKETVNKMRAEMMSLKQNNERLQKMVTSRSLAGSEASLPGGVGHPISPSSSMGGGESRRYSLADGSTRPPMELPKRLAEEVEEENIPPAPAPEPPPPPLSPSTHIDLTPPPPAIEPMPSPAHIPNATEELPDVTDGKKISISCYLGQPESFVKYCEEMLEADEFYANGSVLFNHHAAAAGNSADERTTFTGGNLNEFVIAYTYISGKTTWQNLDYIVRKTFKDYVSRIDPGTNLGLNTDSITSYHLGEAKRGPEMGFPELLPCGYIIGNVRNLYICLQGVGSLAFDSLIPRSIVHRYISLLTEHRRLILCGPSGTGKSYLARRLAEFLVARSGRGNPSEAIATFNVDHKSSKELRQYLQHIAEQAAIANGASELPSVIILDNLHHASALGDVFSSLLSSGPAAKLPCIIGTMSQATCNTTNLQLHHNFRWVLTANHMEPVKGFLGRFLRRRLFQLELQTQHSQPELSTVLAWLPTVWQHINRFLEIHSSSDVTIGPRLFLSCPLDLKNSQVWFTDIWNYHLSPYLVEAVREGVQLYGRRGGAWNDPSTFIRNSYPWPYGPDSVPPLRQINAEDVGLEGITASNGENQDPLLNMLMRLQEAANYSENQEQESDCASLDSNITPDSSAGAE